MSNEHIGSIPMDKVYYFATPYTHPDNYTREMRYLTAVKVATDLINMGLCLIEPIAMSHQHSQRFGLPGGYQFWQTRDRMLIDCSAGVIVCMMDGWEESVGVTDEIQYAMSIGKPVYYLDPETMTIRPAVAQSQGV